MAVSVDIQIASRSQHIPGNTALEHWAAIAVGTHKSNAEISLRIVDKEESQALNNQYRGKDKPTNVLSFPAEFPAEVDIPFLGDLVICAPIVEQEAQTQQKSIDVHWAHMVIHGTLHLLGYDHIEDSEAEQMEALEIQLLASMEYPNPYQ